MEGLEGQKTAQRATLRPASSPLQAIHIDLDAVGHHTPAGNAAQRQTALREYADALRKAGFWVKLGTYDVRASTGRGVGPSIHLVVDGRVMLDDSSGARSIGRLAALGWRPSTRDAVSAAQRWLLDQREPAGWTAARAGQGSSGAWGSVGSRMD